MASPPVGLRKGFSAKLAAALKVDPQTLFSEYVNLKPSEGSVVSPQIEERFRHQISNAASQLNGERLRALNAAANGLLSGSAA